MRTVAERWSPALVAATADGVRLLGSRCAACERHLFPAQETCTYCGSDSTEPVALSASATLWGWTAVTNAPPGYDGPVPYGFGVVELPEGIRIVTPLTEADPSRLSFGQPMALEVDGRGMYSFAPEASS